MVCAGVERSELKLNTMNRRAQEQSADLRRDVGERQRDQHADGRLRRDQVMILEAVVEAELRKERCEGDHGQAGGGIGRADHERYRAGLRIKQQDAGIDDVAAADHDQDLAALLGAARQRLRRRLGADAIQFGRRIHE